ncbi:ABSCISIC ACID-INSENSITIVE 5-like protein 1 [Actinidia eriantha]|uniref:ABSCISIC ACID-INSENSITIVE 5-like protein 1 n=1 Tax=Actinidia eriantha TaxID=165200 RepID=UPI00258B3D34|nr:ABSCISIC ACID-INSENSITIVE 5-like protein 1 [Actinidia eriantha]XP_057480984.1 ABSCISIC ACID-INSENSITIVE 5-like protein 1 [Actinidia eriantha]
MDASDPESIASGKMKSELPQHLPEKSQENHSNSSSNKQNSIFSLTIDEFQYKSGRSFGSMNMDELLNSVWNVEGNPVRSNSNQNTANNDENVVTPINIPRQGSFSIPTPLCNKTVEEVWAHIHRNQSPQHNHNIIGIDVCEHQQTFGEITLEDFLIKVGVIQEVSSISSQQKISESFQNHYGNFPSNDTCLDPSNIGPEPMMGLEFSHPSSENNFRGNGSPMYQVFTPSGSFAGESSNNITGNEKCNGVGEPHTKRRTTNGSMELAVERRQRRMIKNRESAARSRARKQAYTAELEIELNQLREENARLKLILGEAENKRKKEAAKGKLTKAQRTTTKFKTTMRRTVSLDW